MIKIFLTLISFLFISTGAVVHAQSASIVTGRVTDSQRAPVSGASVTITNTATNASQTSTSNSDGIFVFPQLSPATYRIEVSAGGFQLALQNNVIVSVAGTTTQNFQLEVAGPDATVTVADQPDIIERDSGTVGTVIDRNFVENLPLNGRSFQTLIELTPGVVLTPSQVTSPGQFSVNGQRTNSNYFMLDGVGANSGTTPLATSSQQAAGTLPNTTVVGGFNNLASVDELQEFRVLTSSFAPEFGRTPGGQVSLVTRSGTNRYSGSVYNYLRNEIFDANSFFNNRAGIPRGKLRQNNFGFTFAGPLPFLNFGEGVPIFSSGKDRTFFFLSYEGSRVRRPIFRSANVPSLAAREQAASLGLTEIGELLAGFPLPNAAPTTTNPLIGRFEQSLSNPVSLDSVGIRIDYIFSPKFTVFGRYKHTPSSDDQAATLFANQSNYFEVETRLLTVGATYTPRSNLVVDLRGNYTDDIGNFLFSGQEVGGAVLPPLSSLMPSFVGESNASASLQFAGANFINQTRGRSFGNGQRQLNFMGSANAVVGSHQIKFGADYRRLMPKVVARSFGFTYNFTSLEAVLDPTPGSLTRGTALVSVQALAPEGQFLFENFSAFAQDTWRARKNLTLTFGARWDVNTPPSSDGPLPFVLGQVNNLMTAELAPAGTRAFESSYANIAPRFGMSYDIGGFVFRAGAGIFYDLATGQATRGYTSYPFSSVRAPIRVPFIPGSAALEAALQPAPFNTAPPYSSTFYVYDRQIKMPYTLQYNVAVERALGANQSISLTYLGARGRRLLFTEIVRNAVAQTNPNLPIPAVQILNPIFGNSSVHITDNRGRSDYNALQVQFKRRMSVGLQVLSSYTYAHSKDNISSEIAASAAVFRVDPDVEYGPSDFDIRHTFTTAVTYDIPSIFKEGFGRSVFGGFSLDLITRVRSAPPYNAFVSYSNSAAGVSFITRPDLNTGEPLYLYDDELPGGRRANPDAFSLAPVTRQGTLGRNALRGYRLFQTDLAIRREFGLTERVTLRLKAEAFNLFNQPNFSVDSSTLFTRTATTTTPTQNLNFGRATNILANQLSGTGGFSSLYQVGGPRSMQFSARISF